MAMNSGNRESQGTPVDQVEGGPERGPEGQAGGDDRRERRAPTQPSKAAQQPGGGRPSESEKPDSPDSRWGSGKDRGR